MDSIQEYLSLAIEVAREAGDYAHRIHTSDLAITTKTNDMDLVTQVDSRNEQAIRDAVLSRFPDHIVLGEELGSSDGQAGNGQAGSTAPREAKDSSTSWGSASSLPVAQSFQPATVRWIVDPIDGTVNFAHGLPVWCVSVGVEVDGKVECGAIYNPNRSELFTVRRGHGAFLNGKQIHVSKQGNPSQSLFVTGFPYNVDENPGGVIEQFVSFLSRGLLIRRLGSAALDLAYVACGRFDGFWEAGLSPWDSSAGQLMVREAGGRVTHYDGSDYDIYRKSIIATNVLHHEMILKVISETVGASNRTEKNV